MEKMKKNEKGLNKIVFLGEISAHPWQDKLVASPAQCEKIAHRFDIPQVKEVTALVKAEMDGDLVRVSGHLWATMERMCVVSLDLFEDKIDEDFEALFCENATLIKEGEMEDDIEPIDRGRLDIFDIVAEQVGLLLNPFPKKPNVSGDYVEDEENQQKPFANLKNLLKKD